MAVGLAVFILLGGRGLSLTPSSVLTVGAFGRRAASLAASTRYANPTQRKQIAAFGRKFGCHTCGRKRAGFVADHQPPLKLVRRNLSIIPRRSMLRYYPQCAACSCLQAAALRAAKPRSVSRSHCWTLRPYHATGTVVGAWTDLAIGDS